MRGETKPENDLQAEARIKVKKAGVVAAVIVDKDGEVIYHVVSTLWSKLVVLALVAMMLACTIVSMMVFYNGRRITEIQKNERERTEREEGQYSEQSK